MIASLAVPYVRSFGVSSQQFIGSYMPALSVATIDQGGYYAGPIYFKDTWRVTNQTYVFVTVSPASTPTWTGQNIVFVLQTTVTSTTLGVQNLTLTYPWAIPDPFSSTVGYRVLIDATFGSTNPHTFPANTFRRDDALAFRILRDGPNAQDTLIQNVKIAQSLNFQIQEWDC